MLESIVSVLPSDCLGGPGFSKRIVIYPLALFSDCCCYKEWKNNLV